MTEALHPDRRVLNALLAAKDDIARVVLLIQSLQRNGHAYAVEVCSHHLCGCIVPIATGIQIRDGSNQQLQLYIIRRLAGICQDACSLEYLLVLEGSPSKVPLSILHHLEQPLSSEEWACLEAELAWQHAAGSFNSLSDDQMATCMERMAQLQKCAEANKDLDAQVPPDLTSLSTPLWTPALRQQLLTDLPPLDTARLRQAAAVWQEAMAAAGQQPGTALQLALRHAGLPATAAIGAGAGSAAEASLAMHGGVDAASAPAPLSVQHAPAAALTVAKTAASAPDAGSAGTTHPAASRVTADALGSASRLQNTDVGDAAAVATTASARIQPPQQVTPASTGGISMPAKQDKAFRKQQPEVTAAQHEGMDLQHSWVMMHPEMQMHANPEQDALMPLVEAHTEASVVCQAVDPQVGTAFPLTNPLQQQEAEPAGQERCQPEQQDAAAAVVPMEDAADAGSPAPRKRSVASRQEAEEADGVIMEFQQADTGADSGGSKRMRLDEVLVNACGSASKVERRTSAGKVEPRTSAGSGEQVGLWQTRTAAQSASSEPAGAAADSSKEHTSGAQPAAGLGQGAGVSGKDGTGSRAQDTKKMGIAQLQPFTGPSSRADPLGSSSGRRPAGPGVSSKVPGTSYPDPRAVQDYLECLHEMISRQPYGHCVVGDLVEHALSIPEAWLRASGLGPIQWIKQFAKGWLLLGGGKGSKVVLTACRREPGVSGSHGQIGPGKNGHEHRDGCNSEREHAHGRESDHAMEHGHKQGGHHEQGHHRRSQGLNHAREGGFELDRGLEEQEPGFWPEPNMGRQGSCRELGPAITRYAHSARPPMIATGSGDDRASEEQVQARIVRPRAAARPANRQGYEAGSSQHAGSQHRRCSLTPSPHHRVSGPDSAHHGDAGPVPGQVLERWIDLPPGTYNSLQEEERAFGKALQAYLWAYHRQGRTMSELVRDGWAVPTHFWRGRGTPASWVNIFTALFTIPKGRHSGNPRVIPCPP